MYCLTPLYVITSPLALNHCTYILVGFLFQVQVLSSLYLMRNFPSSTLSDKIPQSHMVLMSKTDITAHNSTSEPVMTCCGLRHTASVFSSTQNTHTASLFNTLHRTHTQRLFACLITSRNIFLNNVKHMAQNMSPIH